MSGLGALEALLLMLPAFIVAAIVVLVLVLAWRVWRLSSDIRAIRDAVEYIADCMEAGRRKQGG